jgi:predicted Zn-dependent protease
MRRLVTATLLTFALAVASCGDRKENEPGFNVFTPQEDVEIGRESAAEVLGQLPELSDEEVAAYVRAVGEGLAGSAPGERFPYEFHVLDVGDINAFALPGGIVFVNRGTLEAVHDEGELAGVLAHEISHVALRHGTSQMSKAYVAKRGIDIFRTIFGRRDDAGGVAEGLGGLGLNTLFLRFSREAETEADLAGARMLAERGYDPIEMSRFFDTLRAAETGRVPEFFSDHPDTGNRAQAVADARAALRVSPTPITVTDGFWRMKKALRLLPAAISMRERRVGPNE